MTTITCDDAQRICFVTTDDARELAIPYQAVASWKALLGLGSYDAALDAIIDNTKPGADPIDWSSRYEALADHPDTVPEPVAQPRMARMRSAAIPEESVLAGRHDLLVELETTFVAQVREEYSHGQSRD
ncbi:hypothetical protein [Bifidobacterium castoris]|uniref:Uncharacterized protein n=1 Tax=Bifidobacterium castoris TaxID=2306972 RepID=A0A430F7P1_9BIFI|nr:hypothetical protein [Bifidobacterium castoris]RSX48945.1 hypothetical protein D2E22_1083 [Bifidobacterium castoris]